MVLLLLRRWQVLRLQRRRLPVRRGAAAAAQLQPCRQGMPDRLRLGSWRAAQGTCEHQSKQWAMPVRPARIPPLADESMASAGTCS